MHEGDLSQHFGSAVFEEVMNALADGIVVIDRDLSVLFQNKMVVLLFGSRIGEKCHRAFRNKDEPCTDCAVLKVLDDGERRTTIRDIVQPDGQVMWVEVSSAPLKDKEGRIIAAVEVIHNITDNIRLNEECCTLRREIIRQGQFENIVTQSRKMKDIFHFIEKIAPTPTTVLLTGESGTGKELIARAIFVNSGRKDKPYVLLNCGAIPENLIESELFGHVRGSFTGAVKDHMGLLEAAQGGTLFLDEVGELPMPLQVKLLRFLQEGEARRVGDTKTRILNVRVIAATNRSLDEAVKQGTFREDLYFRLHVFPIPVPPLRERKEDVPLLATHFLERLCSVHNRNVTGISSQAYKVLMDYDWPGNVRELEHAVEYAIHVTDDSGTIKPENLPPKIRDAACPVEKNHDQNLSLQEITKRMILSLQADNTEEGIARILGISRKNLWEKRKRWGIPRS